MPKITYTGDSTQRVFVGDTECPKGDAVEVSEETAKRLAENPFFDVAKGAPGGKKPPGKPSNKKDG